MPVEIKWIHHASFRIAGQGAVVYIDPWKLPSTAGDGDIIVVSHSHFDHFSAADIAKAAKSGASVIGPPDVIGELGSGKAIWPGQSVTDKGVGIEAIPAYNIGKSFHPKANNWIGAVVAIDGKRIYYAGDTDQVPEMSKLKDIDVALLPVGGTYTLNAAEAANACKAIGCKAAIPYHWGDVVGREADAAEFAAAVDCCAAHLLKPGQSLTL
jgi:L-ascorbate metabolism protein UlaG (beta-lactamase superfamily)